MAPICGCIGVIARAMTVLSVINNCLAQEDRSAFRPCQSGAKGRGLTFPGNQESVSGTDLGRISMALTTAQPFTPPTVERLSVRLVVDSYFDLFMPKATHSHVRIEHVSRILGRETSTLAGERGLSLHLESEAAGDKHQYLLDFGFTPDILLRSC